MIGAEISDNLLLYQERLVYLGKTLIISKLHSVPALTISVLATAHIVDSILLSVWPSAMHQSSWGHCWIGS